MEERKEERSLRPPPQPPLPSQQPLQPQPPPAAVAEGKERPFRGVRMRKWGKWVAEIREPNKRSRIWLRPYFTPLAGARSFAVYPLRGRSARLNFPDELDPEEATGGLTAEVNAASLSSATIRKKASEVGLRVDALQQQGLTAKSSRSCKNPDLNQQPSPESSDDD
ncbi:ethylene-responsive transcription factor RAP2-1-like [Phalaenopsis equestris]|uniref:ethylene-responsive transcription factor RAP2-1-like n=1 Tax=Phalaenopsis equestris TaxID=78828 RepID=UPI0009E48776|nr:ethylene-responsive transcription factor RAP2-1-like [Phalaenopsis equestris]